MLKRDAMYIRVTADNGLAGLPQGRLMNARRGRFARLFARSLRGASQALGQVLIFKAILN